VPKSFLFFCPNPVFDYIISDDPDDAIFRFDAGSRLCAHIFGGSESLGGFHFKFGLLFPIDIIKKNISLGIITNAGSLLEKG